MRSPKTANHHRKLISLTALIPEAIAATIVQHSFDYFIVLLSSDRHGKQVRHHTTSWIFTDFGNLIA
jgi:hypothetical protein